MERLIPDKWSDLVKGSTAIYRKSQDLCRTSDSEIGQVPGKVPGYRRRSVSDGFIH